MMDSRIPRFRWTHLVAVSLAVVVLVACGEDSPGASPPEPAAAPETTAAPAPEPEPAPEPDPDSEPAPEPETTAAPEPETTAAPEPAPEPETEPEAAPETTQPPPSSAGLRITSETTSEELLARISDAEAACLSSAMGDTNFELFRAAPILAAAAFESAYELFGACLEDESLTLLGVGLMSAHMGGWADDSLACVTELSRNHPELVSVALGLEQDPAHTTEVHSILLDMYECLDTWEEAAILATMSGAALEVAPFSGQDFIDSLTETDAECLKASVPEALFDMIASAPSVAGGELQDAPAEILDCISPQSTNQMFGGVLAKGMGATSAESRACMVEFAADHSHYMELARTAAADPAALTEEENAELTEDGLKVFSCMSVEELASFQNTYLPRLVPGAASAPES